MKKMQMETQLSWRRCKLKHKYYEKKDVNRNTSIIKEDISRNTSFMKEDVNRSSNIMKEKY